MATSVVMVGTLPFVGRRVPRCWLAAGLTSYDAGIRAGMSQNENGRPPPAVVGRSVPGFQTHSECGRPHHLPTRAGWWRPPPGSARAARRDRRSHAFHDPLTRTTGVRAAPLASSLVPHGASGVPGEVGLVP